MRLGGGGGWRVGVGEVGLGDGAFIVANRPELAKLPLARRSNSTATISITIPICIDASLRELSSSATGRINAPEFRAFGS